MIRRFGLILVAVVLVSVSLRSDAAPIAYSASLSGPGESPPNSSPGFGFAEVDIDPTANTLHVDVSFTNLTAGTTASHIHSATAAPFTGTAGVATTTPTFLGFPLGVTSGVYHNTLDMTLASSYNPAFITANGGTTASAEAALFASIAAGTSYLNIHSTNFPGGEIRGFLVLGTPEPASIVMMGTGILGVIVYGWRTKARTRAA
jgi:hypothetical protein